MRIWVQEEQRKYSESEGNLSRSGGEVRKGVRKIKEREARVRVMEGAKLSHGRGGGWRRMTQQGVMCKWMGVRRNCDNVSQH